MNENILYQILDEQTMQFIYIKEYMSALEQHNYHTVQHNSLKEPEHTEEKKHEITNRYHSPTPKNHHRKSS